MIFTSSSVTSFQDYRLQEKSIQNTILAAGLCSVRMLTFSPVFLTLSYPGVKAELIPLKREKRLKTKKKEERKTKPLQ